MVPLFWFGSRKDLSRTDDHIGLELLFLSHLASLGIQSLEDETDTQFEELLGSTAGYSLKDHLGKWALKWALSD